MIKKSLFLLPCLITLLATAQGNYFSEYNSSKTNLNPAFAGSDSAFVLSSAVQFSPRKSLPFNQFEHYFFSADNYFHFLRGGLALNYTHNNDFAGREKNTSFSLSYAPHFELFDHKLALQPAIEFGVFRLKQQYSFLAPDGSSSQTPGSDQLIPWAGSRTNLDLAAGILLFTKRIYGGIAVHHINKPRYDSFFDDLRWPMQFTVHWGANLRAGDFILSPNILYIQEEKFIFLQAGLRAKYKILTLGLDASTDELKPEIGLQNRFFKLSYCYSHVFSYPTESGSGTHEIHFNWFFKHKNKKQLSLRMI